MPSVAAGITLKPIQFEAAILGLEREGPWTYVDLGPSGTLATFLKYLLPKTTHSRTHHVLSRHGREVENLKRVMNLPLRDVPLAKAPSRVLSVTG